MTAATYAFAQLLRVLPRTRITRAVGKLVDLELPAVVSRAAVGVYARAYDVNLDEAEPIAGAYRSFDAFFTRRLRDGARSVDAPSGALIAPSDGRLDSFGPVEKDGLFTIKGRNYRAPDLLGDARDGAEQAERYLGGQFAIIYLSPRDYHRVHAPCVGRMRAVRSYPGELFPVNRVSEQHIPNYLGRNRRVAIELETSDYGLVTVVMVAAMIVGRISVTGIPERDVPFGRHELGGQPIRRGDELGIFHLGSTAVLFFEPGRCPPLSPRLGPVRLGDRLHAPGAYDDADHARGHGGRA
ncbi:MAG: phosphatidylserine decarboxylase [Deltaproteobacteria bacterium]|nr:phosphatidylserine decarboxylase [Deltaproteobacteria bacterium]